MDKIRDNIYIGNWKEVCIPETLIREGITSILNVAHDHTDRPVDEFMFFKCGMVDGSWPKNIYPFRAALSVLDWLMESGQTVFVHCINGFSRAPFVVAYQSALRNNSTWGEEFVKIRQIRPAIVEKPWMGELHQEVQKWNAFPEKI